MFARFGIPYVVVSDNAPEFTNYEFWSWLQNVGCRLMRTPEYHSRSNGVAERMVRVLKEGLKAFAPQKANINSFVSRLLFTHRNTALRNGNTPAGIMFGRQLRCPLLSQYAPQQDLTYVPTARARPTPVKFVLRQGRNTSIVVTPKGRTLVAQDSQLSPRNEIVEESSISERPRRERRQTRFYPDVDPRLERVDVA